MKTEEIKEQIKELNSQIVENTQIKKKDIHQFLLDKLDIHDVLEEGDEIKGESTSFDIIRSHPDYSYKKELFTIYHDTVGWREEDENKFETTINYYTGGSTNDPWELKRLVTLGKVAGVLENKAYYDQINDGIAKIKSIHRPIIKELYEKVYKLERQLKEIEAEERRQKQNQFLVDLKKGVTFNKEVYFGNTSQEFNCVKSLKVEEYTPSGKSADLKITVDYGRGVDPHTYERRMKVDSFENLYTEPYTVS